MGEEAVSKRRYGEGSIEQRGEKSWRLRYRVNGAPYTAVVHGTKADAKERLRELLRAGDTGEHVDPSKMTFGQWAKEWIAIGAPGRRRRKVGARAVERYEELLRRHVLPTLADIPLQRLRSTDIDKLYRKFDEEKKLAPRTQMHVHSVLSACLGAAVRTKQITVSPMQSVSNVPSPGESDHGTALEDGDLRKLVQGFRGSSLFGVVATLAFTGARRNEVLALRWSDLDPAKKKLRIERALEETKAHGIRFKGPKNEKHKRTISIDDDLLAVLLNERQKHLRLAAGIPDGADVDLSLVRLPEDALMFPNPPEAGAISFTMPRHPRAVTKEFRRKAAKLGFKIRLHDLRGTHETILLDHGVPVKVVAERCGHDPAVLLRNYAKRRDSADDQAAAVIGALSKSILGGALGG